MEAGGIDSAGREFKNAAEMWREELGEGGDDGTKKAQWYSQGVGYWQVCLSTSHPAGTLSFPCSLWFPMSKVLIFLFLPLLCNAT